MDSHHTWRDIVCKFLSYFFLLSFICLFVCASYSLDPHLNPLDLYLIAISLKYLLFFYFFFLFSYANSMNLVPVLGPFYD